MGWPPCGKTMVHWFSTQGARAHRLGLERGAQRRRRARRHTSRSLGVDALRRLGREVLLQRRRSRRRSRSWRSSCCATRRSRAACRRSRSTGTTTRPTTAPTTSGRSRYREIFFGHVLNNRYLWAIAVANAFVYFVRYGVVNWIPDLPADGEGLLVPAVEHRLGALRVRRHPGHDRLRLDVGPVLQGPPRARHHPVHGADARRRRRLLAQPATGRCGSTTPRSSPSAS